MTSQAPMPWEDRPAGANGPMWRNSGNPIIPRDLLPRSNSIFNSAVVPFEGAYAGVFRVEGIFRVEAQLHERHEGDGRVPALGIEPRGQQLGVDVVERKLLGAHGERVAVHVDAEPFAEGADPFTVEGDPHLGVDRVLGVLVIVFVVVVLIEQVSVALRRRLV